MTYVPSPADLAAAAGSRSPGVYDGRGGAPGEVRGPRADLRRRPAAARSLRPGALGDRHDLAADPRDLAPGAAGQRGDGHRHRVADGDRDGPPGRPRRAAPQPVDRGPGLPGRPGQADPDRDHLQPRHDRPRRDAGGARPDLRRVPRLRAARGRPRAAPARHHHQPRPALHPGRGVGHHQGRRGDDPDAADHRPGRDQPRRGDPAAAQAQARAAAPGRRAGPAGRPDHRQGLREVRAVPAWPPTTRTAG